MSLTSAIVDVVARSKIMDWLYIRNGLYKFSLSQRLNNVSTIKKTCNLKAQYVSDRASKLWLGCGSSSCCYLPITSIRPIWPTDCLGIRHIHAWTRRDFFSIPCPENSEPKKKLFTNFHQIQQVATAMNAEVSALKLSTSFHLTRVHTHYLIRLRETKLWHNRVYVA